MKTELKLPERLEIKRDPTLGLVLIGDGNWDCGRIDDIKLAVAIRDRYNHYAQMKEALEEIIATTKGERPTSGAFGVMMACRELAEAALCDTPERGTNEM